jgi:hypothetical protein
MNAKIDAKWPCWMGQKLNNQIESKSIIIFPISKLKGCVHINKDKENPSGKIQRGPKSKPKPKLKVEEEGLRKSLKDVVCQARK